MHTLPSDKVQSLTITIIILQNADYGQNLIKNGGLYINFARVSSTEELVHRDKHLLTGNMTILRTGRYICYLGLKL